VVEVLVKSTVLICSNCFKTTSSSPIKIAVLIASTIEAPHPLLHHPSALPDIVRAWEILMAYREFVPLLETGESSSNPNAYLVYPFQECRKASLIASARTLLVWRFLASRGMFGAPNVVPAARSAVNKVREICMVQ